MSDWLIVFAELNQMLLDLILEFHAWSTSRPEFESASAGDALLDETQSIMNIEREQGMSLFSFGMGVTIQYLHHPKPLSLLIFHLRISLPLTWRRIYLPFLHRANQTPTSRIHPTYQGCSYCSYWWLQSLTRTYGRLHTGKASFIRLMYTVFSAPVFNL